jgi:hypothetical protein
MENHEKSLMSLVLHTINCIDDNIYWNIYDCNFVTVGKSYIVVNEN